MICKTGVKGGRQRIESYWYVKQEYKEEDRACRELLICKTGEKGGRQRKERVIDIWNKSIGWKT